MDPSKAVLLIDYLTPFNPTTTIEYTIPTPPFLPPLANGRGGEGFFVSLVIYDILGREITTLVNEPQKPGTYKVVFDASSVNRRISGGVYYYQLQAGNSSETRKMLIIK